MLKLTGNHRTLLLRHVEEFEAAETNCMKKLLWSIFVLIILLIFIGLASCIQTGDEERPGMAVSKDLLLTKIWSVHLFKENGQNKTGLFQNVFLEFRPNAVFRITKGCEIIEGKWVLSNDSTVLVIRLPDPPEPLIQLEDEWVVTWLSNTELRLVEQDYKGDEEFHLQVAPLQALNCQTCHNLNTMLADNDWSITKFAAFDREFTDESRGAYLDFHINGEVVLYSGDHEIPGNWVLTDNCQTLVLKWYDDNSYYGHYQEMEDNWFILDITNEHISLETDDHDRLELSMGKLQDCSQLRTELLNTSWTIDFMTINEDDVSQYFLGTGLTLLENNQLATEVLVGPAVLGDWQITGNCDHLVIQIQTGQLKELSREWVITEAYDDRLILVFEEGTLRIEMHLKKGVPRPSTDCLQFIDLVTREWVVNNFTENQSVQDNEYQGYHILFKDDGEVLIWNNEDEFSGTWHPVMDCRLIVLHMEDEVIAQKLNGKWRIEKIDDNEIIMVYENKDLTRTVKLAPP